MPEASIPSADAPWNELVDVNVRCVALAPVEPEPSRYSPSFVRLKWSSVYEPRLTMIVVPGSAAFAAATASPMVANAS